VRGCFGYTGHVNKRAWNNCIGHENLEPVKCRTLITFNERINDIYGQFVTSHSTEPLTLLVVIPVAKSGGVFVLESKY
jgi:hypothetical protein